MSKNSRKTTKSHKVSIGGQAVLEGVMMRGERSMATAVRNDAGDIVLETKKIKPYKQRSIFLRLFIIRGVVSFITSMFGGIKVLMRSAEVYGESEPTKLEKWLAKKFKVNIYSVISFFSLLIGLALAIFLFMWLPQATRELIERIFNLSFDNNLWAKNFIEGGLKLAVFILYIALCCCIKDVRRTFMYHGAEHKTISCYESGQELTVANAKKCTRVHDRCGTTFMVFVITISILVFACFESLVGKSLDGIIRVLCKIALLPLVAGISYELLKGLSKTDCWIFYPFKVPGLLLQRLTTKEPDDKMLEVAITAFNTVLAMDKDPTIKEVSFPIAQKRVDLLNNVKKTLKDNGIDEDAEAEWILSLTLNVSRSQLISDEQVSSSLVKKVNSIVEQRITGKPLWYCIGNTDFYGYNIKVDQRVLIPRVETELLVDNVVSNVNSDSVVLDLCTGSGAIAIAVNKETGAKTYAIDISQDAIDLAKENALYNDANVNFIKSDLFSELKDITFDFIVSNPPYIKSEDINHLQKEVKQFEPMLALDGGIDGLDFYRRIAKDSKRYLKKGGILLLEIGYDQAQQVSEMLKGFSSVEVIKDYEKRDRIIKAVL